MFGIVFVGQHRRPGADSGNAHGGAAHIGIENLHRAGEEEICTMLATSH